MSIFNPILFGGSSSNDLLGEEVQGIAGEDFVKGDIVGYFNEPNLIQNLTNFDVSNKYFFDNGNKYYTKNETIKIYDTHTDQLLEERTKPASCYVCNNLEQPDIDYLCYFNYSTKDLIIYKWNPSNNEYVVVRTFTETELKIDVAGTSYSVGSQTYQNPSITKDYLCYIIAYKSSTGFKDYQVYGKIINKTNFEIKSVFFNSGSNSAYFQEITCNYNKNKFLMCAGNHRGSLGMTFQRLLLYDANENATIHSTSLYVGAASTVYMYINDNNGLIAINTTSSSYSASGSYRGVYMVNNLGQMYNIDQYNPPYYFVSASSDFNEIILFDSTNSNFYLANVALKSLTQITEPSMIPNYYQPRSNNSHLMSMKANGAIKVIIRDQTEFPLKVAKITSYTSSFRKLQHPGYGLYVYIGVVKESAEKDSNVIVYKLIDY